MPVSPARAAAFDILLRVERESSFASELLHSKSYASLTTADHALATELVMGVLRWRSRLDDEIAVASSQALSKLDLEILTALRMAVYQFCWLSRIPQHAAVHESVELVKRARKRSGASFVNAVLRKLSAAKKPEAGSGSPSGLLASELAHPKWLVERWVRFYGLESVRKICEHDQLVPTTAIRLRDPVAEEHLKKDGISLDPGSLLAQARRVTKGEITGTRTFRVGQAVIQDEASQLVAALVGRELNGRILDCCAAPGGKTLAISDRNPLAGITAIELHPHRARLLKHLLTKSSPKGRIDVVVADARNLPTLPPFDRVLADVPCSGTGTLSRNPEIKWRLQPQDLADLQARQIAILRSAMKHVAAGGRLIYSTCSLEREENENVVAKALADDRSFDLHDCRAELGQLEKSGELLWPANDLTHGPYLRILPGTHPCDGFFAAILVKKE